MIKVFCDKCGKELLWYGNITPDNMYANMNTMAQNFNTDGFRTYDSASGQWLDLCTNCKALSSVCSLTSNKVII